MLQKQQKQQTEQQSGSGLILQQYRTATYKEPDTKNRQDIEDEYYYPDQDDLHYENEETVDIYEEIRQTSQNISKQLDDQMEMDVSYSEKQLLDTGSAFAKLLEQSNALLTPGTSPTQLSAPESFSETATGGWIPDVRVTQHFSKDGPKDRLRNHTGKNGITPTVAATTIAAYGVYASDTVTVSQTSASQTVSTTQPNLHGRQTTTTTAVVSNVSHKITAITQAYNQRENSARKMAISKGVQMRDNSTSSETIIESGPSSIRCYTYHERSPPLSPFFLFHPAFSDSILLKIPILLLEPRSLSPLVHQSQLKLTQQHLLYLYQQDFAANQHLMPTHLLSALLILHHIIYHPNMVSTRTIELNKLMSELAWSPLVACIHVDHCQWKTYHFVGFRQFLVLQELSKDNGYRVEV